MFPVKCSNFKASVFIEALKSYGVKISMDEKSRELDNIYLKPEKIYFKLPNGELLRHGKKV